MAPGFVIHVSPLIPSHFSFPSFPPFLFFFYIYPSHSQRLLNVKLEEHSYITWCHIHSSISYNRLPLSFLFPSFPAGWVGTWTKGHWNKTAVHWVHGHRLPSFFTSTLPTSFDVCNLFKYQIIITKRFSPGLKFNSIFSLFSFFLFLSFPRYSRQSNDFLFIKFL